MSTKDVTDKMVCDAVAVSGNQHDSNPIIILMSLSGECEKVCTRAMERACARNLIEYGKLIENSWLTE